MLDTDHQFFSQKKEKKILMYSISKHQFCVCNPLVLHEKSVSVPSSNHPCKARTPAHLTGIIVEKHTGPAACSCPSRTPASYSRLEDKMFSCGPKAQTHFPVRSQGPACTYQTTVTHTKGMGKTHGIRLVRAQATFIVASSFLAFI